MTVISRADIHIHTTCSNAFMTPEAVVDYVVRSTNLQMVAITDHDTIAGAIRARSYMKERYGTTCRLAIVVGTEVSSSDGHVIGLFLKDNISPGLPARRTIDLIHAQGGLAIAPHPYARWLRKWGMQGVGDAIQHLPFDAVETRNATPTEICANRIARRRNSQFQRLPEIGGSDAHYLCMIGKAYTLFEGNTPEDLYRSLRRGAVVAGGNICNLTAVVIAILKMLLQRRMGGIIP